MRTQIDLKNATGLTIEGVIDNEREMVLIAFSGNTFAIIMGEASYDDDCELYTGPAFARFCRRDFDTEDLRKVFDTETVKVWDDEDAATKAECDAKSEERQRNEYERLKAKFEGQQ